MPGISLPIDLRNVLRNVPLRTARSVQVTGAGRGLAEAGGSYGSYWTAEKIFEAKSRVVELIYKRRLGTNGRHRCGRTDDLDWAAPGERLIFSGVRWRV